MTLKNPPPPISKIHIVLAFKMLILIPTDKCSPHLSPKKLLFLQQMLPHSSTTGQMQRTNKWSGAWRPVPIGPFKTQPLHLQFRECPSKWAGGLNGKVEDLNTRSECLLDTVGMLNPRNLNNGLHKDPLIIIISQHDNVDG